MTDFIWPSDLDRAENEELNRVCEYAEELLNEIEWLRDQRDEARETLSQWSNESGQLKTALKRIQQCGECSTEFRLNFGSNGERDYYRQIAQQALNDE
ncbi:hypothetical protein [Marinobacterium litorale]|uniref:hypothetical protein n=1 Tax=Marinobacterium litorale TaxID=404770 RepID=UPI0003F4E54E|nr:hypothetical protein [Marinobacterium litorale]